MPLWLNGQSDGFLNRVLQVRILPKALRDG